MSGLPPARTAGGGPVAPPGSGRDGRREDTKISADGQTIATVMKYFRPFGFNSKFAKTENSCYICAIMRVTRPRMKGPIRITN